MPGINTPPFTDTVTEPGVPAVDVTISQLPPDAVAAVAVMGILALVLVTATVWTAGAWPPVI